MLDTTAVVFVSIAYLGLLFAIAYYGDHRARAGRSLIRSPLVYTFSLGVYCTSWTFYGAVGTAARHGIEFITIYTGPTIVFIGWWFVLRKIVRIAKGQRITSIADFIASRYGKSASLGVIVTCIAMLGVMPYIALQLKAVATSFAVLVSYRDLAGITAVLPHVKPSVITDAAFLIAVGMAVFAILFGTRHIDANEHHEGVVAAIAFESVVKLLALLAVGIFVVAAYGGGLSHSPAGADTAAELRKMVTLAPGYESRWLTTTLLSMAAVVCLPRQFHMTVVENVDERHLATASWLFPLYLLLMSLFALPIAAAGLVLLAPEANPDFFVLTVPMTQGHEMLALLAFIGGLSSATSMVIVSAIALSTMIGNELIVPGLLRMRWLRLTERGDLTRLLLLIRRLGIIAVLMLGYGYYRLTDQSGPLAQIGLVSFTAVAQFAPVIIGALFWKGGTKVGAQVGLLLGFATWAYTLLVPLIARADWISAAMIDHGPWGIALLRPEALFGLDGWEPLPHALFWSMLANVLGYLIGSLASRHDLHERIQAALFVDAFRRGADQPQLWRRSAPIEELHALLQRFIGHERADKAFEDYAAAHDQGIGESPEADADLIAFVERLLAGSIGAASARVMVASIAKGENPRLDEVMQILEETHQAIVYSQQLEQKSKELETTARELTRANVQLKELDRLKDDFLSTISHELRTPLASIRSFSEILSDGSRLDSEQSERFLSIIASESRRLTRLLDGILDLARLEQGQADWTLAETDPAQVLADAVAASEGLFREANVALSVEIKPAASRLNADRDRLMQVMINLMSNAAKFCDGRHGKVHIAGRPRPSGYFIAVEDNGAGIAPEDQGIIFEKFGKAKHAGTRRIPGSGLGLTISRHIVEHHGGKIWIRSAPGEGTTFCMFLPQSGASAADLKG
ncbi:MAG: sensor histidine kinase [Xanthobacteraceae bacterium]